MSFETQKKNLDTENQYLRTSLEKEEKALSSLQEELRKLREQIKVELGNVSPGSLYLKIFN